MRSGSQKQDVAAYLPKVESVGASRLQYLAARVSKNGPDIQILAWRIKTYRVVLDGADFGFGSKAEIRIERAKRLLRAQADIGET